MFNWIRKALVTWDLIFHFKKHGRLGFRVEWCKDCSHNVDVVFCSCGEIWHFPYHSIQELMQRRFKNARK